MLYDQVQEATAYILQRTAVRPQFGIVLGTGLGGLVEDMAVDQVIPYKEIPHFPESTVSGHAGKLVTGTLSGVPVVAMAGRFHYYEGYSLRLATLPIRVMKFLGADRLILSTAVGSVNPAHELGDIVFVRDHINLLPDNPLRGPNDDRLGVRFPDMLHAYDPDMLAYATRVAAEQGIRTHQGVYAALTGPNFETPAEYDFLHRIGADLAGMSTVPEVLVGVHMGMKIFAAAMVTDKGYPKEIIEVTTHEEVLRVSEAAAPKMLWVVERVVEKFGNDA